ncbi:hypothetical protein EV424DRAFT_1345368 [Suillus variegatus]|nr:hypothetical protein EV424DRAFT_1345368 [Suillus variegatus]
MRSKTLLRQAPSARYLPAHRPPQATHSRARIRRAFPRSKRPTSHIHPLSNLTSLRSSLHLTISVKLIPHMPYCFYIGFYPPSWQAFLQAAKVEMRLQAVLSHPIPEHGDALQLAQEVLDAELWRYHEKKIKMDRGYFPQYKAQMSRMFVLELTEQLIVDNMDKPVPFPLIPPASLIPVTTECLTAYDRCVALQAWAHMLQLHPPPGLSALRMTLAVVPWQGTSTSALTIKTFSALQSFSMTISYVCLRLPKVQPLRTIVPTFLGHHLTPLRLT